MVKIDLKKESIEEAINENTESIEFYRDGSFLGRYKLDHPEAITELNIKDLIISGNHYFVPAYQRGYRWTPKQVTDLLDDIWYWKEKSKYCLQPIVINQKDNGLIELVDGQQRLTTIFIILRAAGLSLNEIQYQIEYETRKGTADFLENGLGNEEKSTENIDWYNMNRCYTTAKDYFEDLDDDGAKTWLEKFTDEVVGAFFIQYQILKEVDTRKVEQIFTGLNAGKIPLTNSELIKALILREKNFKTETYQNEFVEISREWDRIERRLQEPNFWAWLGQNVDDDSPHIDLVLNIIAELIKKEHSYDLEKKSYQELFSYSVISKYLSAKENSVTGFWRKVEQCFMTLEDWYSDFDNYHLIGYLLLTNRKKTIKDIYEKYLKSTSNISDYLKKEVPQIKFEQLYYGDNEVNNALLLFNIVTCINTKSKFHFDEYVKGHYDVEHISPHSGFDDIKRVSERISWIEAIQNSELEVFSDISPVNAEETANDKNKFTDFYDLVINKSPGKVDDLDKLGNLCLLDAETNRSYGNKPFPLKLQEIVKVDKTQSRYLLPTTKNVFLKYYSTLNVNNFAWDEKDVDNYESTIEKTLINYFGWGNDDEK